MAFEMKNFGMIRASMINWLAANQSEITDFNEGSTARVLVESFASELSEIYFRIFDALSEAQAEAIYAAFDFPRKSATTAAGIVLFQRETLTNTPISISSGSQVAVPATSSDAEITFTSSSNYTLPASTTIAAPGITSGGQTSFDLTSAANVEIGDVLLTDSERLRVTNVSGATVTVTRGYQSTSATTHTTGTAIGVVGKAVSVTADVVGSDGNVEAEAISKLNTVIAGITSVTNEAAFTGGSDEETDDARKKRFQEFISGLARGTKEAIQFGAKQTAGVVSALCIDNTDDMSIDPGFAVLYVADSSGTADSTLLAAVVAEEENWRPAGLSLTVSAPSIVSVNVTVALALESGFDSTSIKDQVDQSITDYITSLQMGEDVRVSRLIRTIIDTNPTAIQYCTLSLPAADVTIDPSEIARPGTITLTVI